MRAGRWARRGTTDVLTTGATVTQFALALAAAGVRVDAAVVVAAG
ncbi:hypothetical protein [Corynebacterium bovis]